MVIKGKYTNPKNNFPDKPKYDLKNEKNIYSIINIFDKYEVDIKKIGLDFIVNDKSPIFLLTALDRWDKEKLITSIPRFFDMLFENKIYAPSFFRGLVAWLNCNEGIVRSLDLNWDYIFRNAFRSGYDVKGLLSLGHKFLDKETFVGLVIESAMLSSKESLNCLRDWIRHFNANGVLKALLSGFEPEPPE